MCVRHFQANDGKAASVAVEGLFDGVCDGFGEDEHLTEIIVGDVEELVHLELRDDQRMSFAEREDIQKSEELIVLRYLVRRNLSRNYF